MAFPGKRQVVLRRAFCSRLELKQWHALATLSTRPTHACTADKFPGSDFEVVRAKTILSRAQKCVADVWATQLALCFPRSFLDTVWPTLFWDPHHTHSHILQVRRRHTSFADRVRMHAGTALRKVQLLSGQGDQQQCTGACVPAATTWVGDFTGRHVAMLWPNTSNRPCFLSRISSSCRADAQTLSTFYSAVPSLASARRPQDIWKHRRAVHSVLSSGAVVVFQPGTALVFQPGTAPVPQSWHKLLISRALSGGSEAGENLVVRATTRKRCNVYVRRRMNLGSMFWTGSRRTWRCN
jgi:hypothetical protein